MWMIAKPGVPAPSMDVDHDVFTEPWPYGWIVARGHDSDKDVHVSYGHYTATIVHGLKVPPGIWQLGYESEDQSCRAVMTGCHQSDDGQTATRASWTVYLAKPQANQWYQGTELSAAQFLRLEW